MMMKGKVLPLSLAWLFLVSCSTPWQEEGATVVFLVRHAEEADADTDDPPLSPEGAARAANLAQLLRDARISHLHSTRTLRTLETARPVGEVAGIDVEVYDARNLEALTSTIRSAPGRHLVVGHSNTTPTAVRLLGGEPGGPIEEWEHDRLYILTLHADGSVTTVLLRFPATAPFG
jgi:phosphohistidine phosphatase SixA